MGPHAKSPPPAPNRPLDPPVHCRVCTSSHSFLLIPYVCVQTLMTLKRYHEINAFKVVFR